MKFKLTTLIALFSIGVGSVAIGQEKPGSQTPSSKEMSIKDRDMLQSIKELRRQFGGLDLAIPTADQSGKTPTKSGILNLSTTKDVDQLFDKQLRQKISDMNAISGNRLNPPSIGANQQPTLKSAIGSAPMLPAKLNQTSGRMSKVSALRSAARHLDMAAADLEDSDQYDLSDNLRRQAQQIRQTARKLARTGANIIGQK